MYFLIFGQQEASVIAARATHDFLVETKETMGIHPACQSAVKEAGDLVTFPLNAVSNEEIVR